MSEQVSDTSIQRESDGLIGLLEYRKLIHDLRNGLSPILMQAQLLSQYAEASDTEADSIKKSADAIEQSVKAMVVLLSTK